MVQLPSEFRPALEIYRGPLDLLLYLIKKDEVDVFDIPIARIVEQYQIYLELLKELDPNACGEFLVMAANLMEIKSKLLLPREELAEEEELEDPRIELVRQLLEYKKYKERALLLEQRIDERRRRYERPRITWGPDEIETEGAISLGNVTVWDLFTAFHKIQIALGTRDPHRVVVADRPVEEYIRDVERLLCQAHGRTALFESLFAEARSRQEAIGYLLAVLEMAKERRLSLHQEELFGPIQVRLHTEEETRILIAKAAEEAARTAMMEPAEKFLLEGEGAAAAREPLVEAGDELAGDLDGDDDPEEDGPATESPE